VEGLAVPTNSDTAVFSTRLESAPGKVGGDESTGTFVGRAILDPERAGLCPRVVFVVVFVVVVAGPICIGSDFDALLGEEALELTYAVRLDLVLSLELPQIAPMLGPAGYAIGDLACLISDGAVGAAVGIAIASNLALLQRISQRVRV
jgi:hypothetical protein